jgi:hypothetical protein
MTFLNFSRLFGLLAVLHGVSDLNFKLCAFVINGIIKEEIEKPSGQFLGLIVMNHWFGEVWIQIWDSLVVLTLSFVHLENRVCLSFGVQVAGAAWRVETRIVAGVRDLVQRIGEGRIGRVLGDRVIERLGDAVCGLYCAQGDEERGFLGWASKPRSIVCQWIGFKITKTVFSGLASKPVVTVSWLSLKTKVVEGFSVWVSKPVATVWCLKITVTVSWFGPQNQAGFGLSVAPQNRWEDATAWDTHRDLAACFTWKQLWLGFPSLTSRLAESW